LNPLKEKETQDYNHEIAMYQSAVYGNEQMLLAKQNKAIKRADPNITNNDGCSPLWIAASKGNVECVRILLKYGANMNEPDQQKGTTPLFVACQNGKEDVVNLLLSHNVEVNMGTTCCGITPIIKAVSKGYTDIVEALLKHGADIKKVTKTGTTCIGYAAGNGKLETMKILHSHLIDSKLNEDDIAEFMNVAEDEHGYTPLMIACQQNHADIAKYLVNMVKVDISKKNIYQRTAEDVASRNGHQSLAVWLSQIKIEAQLLNDGDHAENSYEDGA